MNANEMVDHAEYLSLQYVEDRYQKITGSSGCSRSVTIEGEYAFKAVHNAKNANQNRAEWDFYLMTTDEVRAKLAKPVYISRNGNVIVMEVLTPWTDRTDRDGTKYGGLSRHETMIETLTNEAHGFAMADLHGGNWGIRPDNTVVLLDYGWIEHKARQHEQEKLPAATRWHEEAPAYMRDFMVDLLLTPVNN